MFFLILFHCICTYELIVKKTLNVIINIIIGKEKNIAVGKVFRKEH